MPRSALVAASARAVSMRLLATLAMLELGIAREVVITGFAVTYTTLAVAAVILVAPGGKGILHEVVGAPKEEWRGSRAREHLATLPCRHKTPAVLSAAFSMVGANPRRIVPLLWWSGRVPGSAAPSSPLMAATSSSA